MKALRQNDYARGIIEFSRVLSIDPQKSKSDETKRSQRRAAIASQKIKEIGNFGACENGALEFRCGFCLPLFCSGFQPLLGQDDQATKLFGKRNGVI